MNEREQGEEAGGERQVGGLGLGLEAGGWGAEVDVAGAGQIRSWCGRRATNPVTARSLLEPIPH
jgi:hypothetical protein